MALMFSVGLTLILLAFAGILIDLALVDYEREMEDEQEE